MINANLVNINTINDKRYVEKNLVNINTINDKRYVEENLVNINTINDIKKKNSSNYYGLYLRFQIKLLS